MLPDVMKSKLLTFLAILALVGAARAELVISNFDQITEFPAYLGNNYWRGQSFQTSSGDWTLNSVVLNIGAPYVPNFAGATDIEVAIYSNSGSDLPDTSLGVLSGPSTIPAGTPPGPPGTFFNATYTSGSGLSLNGDTRYWIVVHGNVAGEESQDYFGWSQALDGTTTGAWTIPFTNPTAYSQNAGGIWYAGPTSDNGVQIFEINATGAAPIPEPGTWVAMAVFAGGAAFAGWRRRKVA
jgi:hypothetical protein